MRVGFLRVGYVDSAYNAMHKAPISSAILDLGAEKPFFLPNNPKPNPKPTSQHFKREEGSIVQP